MSLPESSPKLSKWFFLLSDALLIAVAAFIAANSERPLSPNVIIAIVACVSIGAVVTAAAFIADFLRKQEESLDDRQHAIEALSRTVAASAEQISIVASGLNEISEQVARSVKHAEHLPHKLQEKINDFTRQLNEIVVTENEALQQEVNTLRASEAEKLEAAGDRIAKTAAELSRLEAATAKHTAASSETLARLNDTFAKVRTEAETALSAAHSRTLQEFEEKIATLVRNLDINPTALKATAAKDKDVEPVATPAALAPADAAPLVESAPPSVTTPNPAPVVQNETAPAAGTGAAAEAVEPKPRKPRAPRKTKPVEPVLPAFEDEPTEVQSSIQTDEFTQLAPDEAAPARSVSADGSTRLLVTAYIGIGNRLFIRGEGPGLSWEKGVPLQFVSIGKWRWETGEASGLIQAKLYKNDEAECVKLGTLALEPGHQTEVSAAF